MRRNRPGHIEAFFNVRHANIDIEVSGNKGFHYYEFRHPDKNNREKQNVCVIEEVNPDLLEVPHWISITRDLFICLHDLLDLWTITVIFTCRYS